ncbi:hypothetical protein Tco_1310338 [Tanacetum coccineum]
MLQPTITFPGIEEHDMFSIIYEPVHGIIYKNSKKEKRNDSQKDVKKLVADIVSAALEAQAANMANTDNITRPREALVARELFSLSNYTEDCKVKFATSTLTEEALSSWNSFAQPIGIEEA